MPYDIRLPITFPADTDAEILNQSFGENGYLLLEGFYTTLECEQLKQRMTEMIAEFNPTEHLTVFSTENQQHSGSDYFQESGDKIRFFLEKKAVSEDGKLRVPRHHALNKVGHALHDLDPVFSRFSRKPELAGLVMALGIKQPLLLQSMYMFKPPYIGSEAACHQDSTFLYTEPESVIGLWVALEDATTTNGCLWVAAGGHKQSLRRRFHYQDDQLKMTLLDESPLPEATIPLEAKQGTLVVLHGRLPHQSSDNLSAHSRHAYTLHIIDGACHYPEDNWLHRSPELPPRGF